MTFLSLFSGIGGLDLGLERAGFRCVGQVEIDPFCRAVLEKHWPNLFRWCDVTDLPAELIRFVCGSIDCIAGGFACQDVSAAGKGAGIGKHTRSGLTWRNLFRLARGLRPTWLIIENVPALRSRGADRVLRALERIGYTCWAWVVGARDVGAPHKRQRVFIVAHRDSSGFCGIHGEAGRRQDGPELGTHAAREGLQDVADTIGAGRRTGPRESRDEVCSGQRRSEFIGNDTSQRLVGGDGRAGRANVDNAAIARCTRDARREKAREVWDETRRAKPARSCGVGQADANRSGLGEHGGPVAVSSEQSATERDRSYRWPARPGQQQHEWEAPRLIEFPLGGDVAGIPVRLVRFANRNALKAFGNAVVPDCAEVIGRAILATQGGPHAS